MTDNITEVAQQSNNVFVLVIFSLLLSVVVGIWATIAMSFHKHGDDGTWWGHGKR